MFGWFKKRFPDPREVQDRLESVESSMRRLQVEWEETLEKVTRAAWRASKAKTPPPSPEDATRGAGAPGSEEDPRWRHLDPVSRRIMAQRHLRVAKPGGSV